MNNELLIKNHYYVSIEQNPNYPNVLVAKYPANYFRQPTLEATNIQYYLDKESIIVTDLTTKQTVTVPTKLLYRRCIVTCDIFARAIHRGMHYDLVMTENGKTLFSLMETHKSLLPKENEVFDVLKLAVKQNAKAVPLEYKKAYEQFLAIFKNGGIL